MKVLWIGLFALGGAAVGLCQGTVGLFYGCMLIDRIMYPEGAPTGGGLMAVGWVFMLITAPAGVGLGGALGAMLGLRVAS